MSKPASEKQILFLRKLAKERLYEGSMDFDGLSSIEASRLIDKLLSSPYKQQQASAKNVHVAYALSLYKMGRSIEAFEQLLSMTSDGVVEAQFLLGKICKENFFSYLEADIWEDLLAHNVEPRREVAELLYQSYRERGDSTSARRITEKENLSLAKEDLNNWDIFQDTKRVFKEANRIVREAHSLGYELQSKRTFEVHYKLLKSMSELANLKSQFKYSGLSEDVFRGHGLFSGVNLFDGDFLLNDLADLLAEARQAWEEMRWVSSNLIVEYHAKGSFEPKQLFLLARIGQDAQEQINFFRDSFKLENNDDKAKQELFNISFGLKFENSLAAWYYDHIVQNS